MTTAPDDFGRHGAIAFASQSASLSLNMLTGILVARLLGPDGRGMLTAAMAAVPAVGMVFALSCGKAVAYHHARHPQDGGRLLATWLVLFIPLGALAILVGQLLLPTLLAAQDAETLDLARLYMVAVVVSLTSELVYGIVLGDHDFLFYNAMTVLLPCGTAVLYVVLWVTDEMSVTTALAAYVAAWIGCEIVATTRVLRRHGLARPSVPLAVSSLWYAARAHGANAGGIVNSRLDVIIMPAFLAASSVGLYAVATNVSWIVVTVAGSLAAIVLPAAARLGERGSRTVVYSLHATLLVAAILAAALALAADVAVRLVYGDPFAGGVEALRLLLPGCVLYAGASVLWSGLYAANRPFSAALSQGAGIVFTVVGLLLFLESGGIVAASLVSTTAYAVIFVTALFLYRSAAGLAWSAFIPSVAELRSSYRRAVAAARARRAEA